MNWIWDVSGFTARGQIGAGWTPLLRMLNEVSHAVIAVSYLIIVVNILRVAARKKADLGIARSLRYVPALLFLCALLHAGDVLVFYWPNYHLFTAVVMLAAAFAAVAAYDMPRFTQTLSRLKYVNEANRLNDELRLEARTRTETERDRGDRYEQLKVRVLALEDALRRNTWVGESGEALQQLHQMLAGFESVLGAPPVETALPDDHRVGTGGHASRRPSL